MIDKAIVKKLQTAVGSASDGIIGEGTLTAIYRKLGASVIDAQKLGRASNVFLRDFGILDEPFILAHFLAQAAKETGGFRFFTEIASGQAYEGRVDLGNTVPGYGVMYKGRGIFQLTGHANYVLYSKITGLELVTNPVRAAEPDISVLIACHYWKRKSLTTLALKDDVVAITRGINGGTNGLDERKQFLALIKGWMGLK